MGELRWGKLEAKGSYRSKLDSRVGIRISGLRVPALDDDNGISSLPRRLKATKVSNERRVSGHMGDEIREGRKRIGNLEV